MGDHSTFSPSRAPQFLRCPGSTAAQQGLPDSSSPYAREGTFFHSVAASCLRGAGDAWDHVGTGERVEGEWYTFNETMAGHMQPALDWIAEQRGEVYVEHWVDLTRWLGLDPVTGKRQGGTADVGIIDDSRVWLPDWRVEVDGLITVLDWKYGAGVPVSARWNEQLMLYALGFWWNIARHQTRARTFRLVVEQPRVEGGGGTWFCDLDDLLQYGREVSEAVDRALAPDAPRIAGLKQCMWCKRKESKKRCREYDAFNLDNVGARLPDFDEGRTVKVPATMGMSPERRSYILKHRAMFEKFLEQLHADALEDALMGRPVPGLKAIRGRRPGREWVDEAEAEMLLINELGPEEAYVRKVRSVAQTEELMGKKTFGTFLADLMQRNNKTIIRQGEGKPILVDADAKGDPIPPAIDRLPD